jgi:hypothetical protein
MIKENPSIGPLLFKKMGFLDFLWQASRRDLNDPDRPDEFK